MPEDLVEIKLRRQLRTPPLGPAKIGAILKVKKELAENIIARGGAVLYD